MTDTTIQSEDEDLEAGFKQASGEAYERELEVPGSVTDPTQTTEEQQSAVETAFNDLTQEEKTSLRGLLSESGSLKQGLSTLAGTVGGINRTLLQLQAVQRTAPQGSQGAAAAAKVAQALKAAMDEEVSVEYPELGERLTKALTKGLAGVTGQGPATSIDVDALEQRVEARVERNFNRKLLTKAHPQWEVEIAMKDETGAPIKEASGKYRPSPAFMGWLASKDDGFKQEFMQTDDADFLVPALDDFKTFRSTHYGAPAQPAPTAAPATAAAARSKQARLAAAVVPRGTSGAASTANLTEDDAMALGWKAARGS